MSSSRVNIDPKAVRYSQGSIANHFSGKHGGAPLQDACTQLQSGVLSPSAFPPIRVFKDDNGVLHSHDNRRLWVFREAGVTSVDAELVSKPPPAYKAPPPESARADYSPKVRGKGKKG